MSKSNKEVYVAVESVGIPGNYKFAKDPNSETVRNDLETYRPFHEVSFTRKLLTRLGITDIWVYDLFSGTIKTNLTIINRYASSVNFIYLGDDYTSISFPRVDGLTAEQIKRGMRISILELKDVGRPYLNRDGELNYRAGSGRDGVFTFEIGRLDRRPQSDLWGASLTTTGTNPGLFIAAAIDLINERKQEFGFPIWQQT